MTLAGVGLIAAAAVASWRSGRPATMLDASGWPAWATVAGVALAYAGSRGARR